MKIVYTSEHKYHVPGKEFSFGKIIPSFEKPERAEYVIAEIRNRGFGEIVEPSSFDRQKLTAIHTEDYVSFLENAWQAWDEEGLEGPLMGCVFNQHQNARIPGHIEGRMGFFIADTTIAITETSWQAIKSSADAALTAQEMITHGEKTAFALCRPSGHHATAGIAAGYCYLNNAAIAAQNFLNNGCSRVAIIDVDYHHGNGTQEIFYDRADVFFTSIHADPFSDYPYYLGYADEFGVGAGEGFNRNYPLPDGTQWDAYANALSNAIDGINKFQPDAVVVSLGVDTFKDDPISRFKLESPDYLKMGKALANLNAPVLFVMEGGYAVEGIGINTANVLEAYINK